MTATWGLLGHESEKSSKGPSSCFVEFLSSADVGLLGSALGALSAPEVRLLTWCCSELRDLLVVPGSGCLCPRLRPRTALALAAALVGCIAPQLRSFRPVDDFDSSSFLPELASRLKSLVRLEQLGPLSIDTCARALMALPMGSGVPLDVDDVDGAHNRGPVEAAQVDAVPQLRFATARSLLPLLAEGFMACRMLCDVSLTVRCADSASARLAADWLLPALGGCSALHSLCLDVDSTLGDAGQVFNGIARLLTRLAAPTAGARLSRLSLGYLWWSEASDEALAACNEALASLVGGGADGGGGLRELAVRYPQDQEFGGLDAACQAMEGACQSLEHVVVVEAWGQDGSGFSSLRDFLGSCPRLRTVDINGILPPEFDTTAYAQRVVQRQCGQVQVAFNSAQGWCRAAAAAASAGERARLEQQVAGRST